MDDLTFRQEVLDPLSASFCGAKWYNATIWLGSGMTTSCHHPPAHHVSVEEVTRNPSALHNTPQKKKDRSQMIAGERPPGCDYCWKIEDMGNDAISDRVYKSKIFPIELLKTAAKTDVDADVNLRTLEISFDRTCQFACSYCNPAFSSTWVNDIKKNGIYKDLITDGRNHFTHLHDSAQLYKFGQTNPYIEAFFRWWESDLHKTLTELRITGGEPLMSGYTWQLIDWFKENPGRSQTRLAINSNLGCDKELIDKLHDSCRGIELHLYTSNESTDTHAEYIRDGLDWEAWVNNVEHIMKKGQVRTLNCMCTINALCLESLPDFLTRMMNWKHTYGIDFPNFTLNILRFPSFQSPLVLPEELRRRHKEKLQKWLDTWGSDKLLHLHEKNHVRRLIDYLDTVKTPHNETFDMLRLLNDFKLFYQQYDQRRSKNFTTTFPKLAEWYESIQIQQQ
jgi:organic radical activating enzyme